jgi:hypothetical protein
MLGGVFFRGRTADRGKKHSDEDLHRNADNRKQNVTDWTYQLSFIFLTTLLMSTLYLLRRDNTKLALAESAIRSLKDHVSAL